MAQQKSQQKRQRKSKKTQPKQETVELTTEPVVETPVVVEPVVEPVVSSENTVVQPTEEVDELTQLSSKIQEKLSQVNVLQRELIADMKTLEKLQQTRLVLTIPIRWGTTNLSLVDLLITMK